MTSRIIDYRKDAQSFGSMIFFEYVPAGWSAIEI